MESNGFFHYHETVSLVQFAVPEGVFLLDPLAVKDLTALGAILADPGVLKVLHGCDYDLRSFDRQYGFRFVNLYDTAVATRLLNPDVMGLGRALETYLGVTVSKTTRLQRSDWSRRPLPADALAYAAGDAAHLLALKERLDGELAAKGRGEWMREECGLLEAVRYEPPPPPEEACFGTKGTFDLEPGQLAVFRELYLMRDREAEGMDRPAFKVVSNDALLALAREPDRPLKTLPNANRRWLFSAERRIRAAIERGRHAEPLTHPSRLKRRPSPWYDEARERWKRLNGIRQEHAARLGISPSTLWPTKSLELVALDPDAAEAELSGTSAHGVRRWQRGEFGPALREALARDGRSPGLNP